MNSWEQAKSFTNSSEQGLLWSELATLISGLIQASRSRFIGPLPDVSNVHSKIRAIAASYIFVAFPEKILSGEPRNQRHAHIRSAADVFANKLDLIVDTLARVEFSSYEELPGDLMDDFMSELWTFIHEFGEWKTKETVILLHGIMLKVTRTQEAIQTLAEDHPDRLAGESTINALMASFEKLSSS
jgi:hypothetical protein